MPEYLFCIFANVLRLGICCKMYNINTKGSEERLVQTLAFSLLNARLVFLFIILFDDMLEIKSHTG